MAPTLTEALLSKRQYYYGSCDPNIYDCGNSTWYNWGRWVALAVIVIAFILLALAFSCINNRRRRRRGAPPMYGTGWIPYGHKWAGGQIGPNGYYPNQPYNGGQAAPPYEPPIGNQATGNTFNSNDGYYGHHVYGQQTGIELQEPQSSYQPQRGGDPVYDAPAGPPPGKGDYVVR